MSHESDGTGGVRRSGWRQGHGRLPTVSYSGAGAGDNVHLSSTPRLTPGFCIAFSRDHWTGTARYRADDVDETH